MAFHRSFAAMLAGVSLALAGFASETPGEEYPPFGSQFSSTPAERLELGGMERAAAGALLEQHPEARLYQKGSRVTRVYGTVLADGTSPEDAADAFRFAHSQVFGVPADDLLPLSQLDDHRHAQPVMYDREADAFRFTLIYFTQHKEGIPVFEADLRVLVRNEPGYPVVWAGSSLKNIGDFEPEAGRLRAAAAFDPAGTRGTTMTNFTMPETVIFAGADGQTREPTLAVTFIGDNEGSASADKPERWRYVVNPETGDVLYEENLVIFTDITGSVSGKATTGGKASQCSPEVSTGMPHALVGVVGGESAYADAGGQFVIPHNGTTPVTVESPMTGLYFYVDNVAGDGTEETLTTTVTPPGPANFLHNSANTSELILAQVNGYLQANIVRDFALAQNPFYPTVSGQTDFPVFVNRNDEYCPGNAWYNGWSINFCRADFSYANTAFAAVIHHEYGHHLVATGGSGQGAYGEGMADCAAMLIADDPRMGCGFYYSNCESGIRTADNEFQYPCTGEIHYCGQLLTGCVWSTRNELAISYPSNYLEILSALTINSIMLHSGTSIDPEITIDFLTLDDNDGYLSNGTPHVMEICAGFGDHNMDCPAYVFGAIDFEYPQGRPEIVHPDQTNSFAVRAIPLTGDPLPGTGQLHYSIDGGSWVAVSMTQTAANEYEAVLPAVDCTSVIDWYVSAEADDAGTYTDPPSAPPASFLATAGRATTNMADSFETDQGWSVGAAGDDATAGIWERADPEQTTAQPGDDHSPNPAIMCWITDATAGANQNSYDVDGGATSLTSPIINLAGAIDPSISYYRWYANGTGSNPNEDVLLVNVSNDNGATWTNVETIGPSGPDTAGGWVYHSFKVADFVTPTAQVRVRFVASDEGGDSTIEAAIDDFKVATWECDLLSPSPNPMQWETPPSPVADSHSEAYMIGVEATDAAGVEYRFECVGGGCHTSAWQDDQTYTDTNLSANSPFTYAVRAADKSPQHNTTTLSTYAQVITGIQAPATISFPVVTDASMDVNIPGTFTNLAYYGSGIYLEVMQDGAPVGTGDANTWKKSQTFNVTGLAPGTTYTFRAKARNMVQLETIFTEPFEQATTGSSCTLYGDMNGDGLINGDDVAGFVRAKLGQAPLSGENQDCADYGGTMEEDVQAFVLDLLASD